MFGTATFSDAPFASEAGSTFQCLVAEGMAGTAAVVPVSLYYAVTQDTAQTTVNTSSINETNATFLSSSTAADTTTAQIPFTTIVSNRVDAVSVAQTNADFAVTVSTSSLAADMVLSAPMYQTMVVDGVNTFDNTSAIKIAVGTVSNSLSGTQTSESTVTIHTNINESGTGADMITALGDLHAVVTNIAEGSVLPNVVQQLNTVVSNNVGVSDTALSRLLWEVINDFESGTWGTISNTQTVTWGNVSTDTDSGWIEIKTLN